MCTCATRTNPATGVLRDVILGEDPFPETTAGVLTSLGDMLTSVEGTAGSIGFGNWTGVAAESRDIETPTLDGVAPSDPAYPVVVTLGVGYAEARADAVMPFVDWLLSEEGQAALIELGMIGASTE